MTITPDSKDWTWVLQRPCPECGFDTRAFPVTAVPGMITANAAAWQDALTGEARGMPAPARNRASGRRWSTAVTSATCSGGSTSGSS